MIVIEFQPRNPYLFADGLCVVEPATTLSRLELTDGDPDDAERIVRASSVHRQV